MRRTRWIGGLAASAVMVGTLAAGGGTAFADAPAPTPAPGSNERVCATRIPALLTKIDALTTKINGNAGTKGSTAWLQAREDRARSAGRTAQADLLGVRVAHRADRLTELTRIKDEVVAVQKKDCG